MNETAAKYRKKPIVIEAIRWTGYNLDQVTTFMGGWQYSDGGRLFIGTLEGSMAAEVGDYIIRGVAGELYPCKPDIFEKTYERVEEN
ncbi:hypothetical protein D3C74_49500 [compost metagenome]